MTAFERHRVGRLLFKENGQLEVVHFLSCQSIMKIILFCLLLGISLLKPVSVLGWEVSLVREEVSFPLPFATDPQLRRAYLDLPVPDREAVARADLFLLEFQCSHPEAVVAVNLYFHSERGWYNHRFSSLTPVPGKRNTFLGKALRRFFMVEGKPAPWDKVDKIRVAAHRKDEVDAEFTIKKVLAAPLSILTLVPRQEPGRARAEELITQMGRFGIETGTVMQDDLDEKKLLGRTLVVLPDNADPTKKTVGLLRDHLERGGKLIAIGTIPAELKETLDADAHRGVFLAGFPSRETPGNRDAFMIDLFSRYDNELSNRLLATAWESLFEIGDPRRVTQQERRERGRRYLAILAENGFELEESFFQPGGQTYRKPLSPLLEELRRLRETESIRYCDARPSKSPEFRAWWEHSGTGGYQGDWDRTMKELSEIGFNAIIVNMCTAGSALYPSDYLPPDDRLGRMGDQVRLAVAAGKKYGIEVHAWKVHFNLLRSPEDHVDRMRREKRLQRSFDGDELLWLCPSHPENIELEWKSMCELLQRYELDGIHLDYIRYPGIRTCFCDGCRERFTKELGRPVDDWPAAVWKDPQLQRRWFRWRCETITALVERIRIESKRVRPDAKLSAAVFRDYPEVLETVGQDWHLWSERKLLDFLCPMNYTADMDQFEYWLDRQTSLADIPVYPGIVASSSRVSLQPDQVVAQIELARQYGAEGFVLFNLNSQTLPRLGPILHSGVTQSGPSLSSKPGKIPSK